MPHRTGHMMSGLPHMREGYHSPVDHNPHEDVPGSDAFSKRKVMQMAEGRK